MHALRGCDTTSSNNGVDKATTKLLSNKHLHEAGLIFTTNSKSNKEIKSSGNAIRHK